MLSLFNSTAVVAIFVVIAIVAIFAVIFRRGFVIYITYLICSLLLIVFFFWLFPSFLTFRCFRLITLFCSIENINIYTIYIVLIFVRPHLYRISSFALIIDHRSSIIDHRTPKLSIEKRLSIIDAFIQISFSFQFILLCNNWWSFTYSIN